MEHLKAGPTDQANCAQHQEAHENQSAIGAEWRGWQGDRKCDQQQPKPYRIFCRLQDAIAVGPPLPKHTMSQGQQRTVDYGSEGKKRQPSAMPKAPSPESKITYCQGRASLCAMFCHIKFHRDCAEAHPSAFNCLLMQIMPITPEFLYRTELHSEVAACAQASARVP